MTQAAMWWARCRAFLGLAGLCGLLAAVGGGWLHGVLVQDARAQRAAMQAELSALRAAPPASAASAGGAAAAIPSFPAADTLPDWLERIEAASAATGVTVERTEYRASAEAPAKLSRYQIALPVKGTYAQVRAFVAALLEAVPTLAVTDVDLKRDAIGSATVEARLSVAVYLRAVPR